MNKRSGKTQWDYPDEEEEEEEMETEKKEPEMEREGDQPLNHSSSGIRKYFIAGLRLFKILTNKLNLLPKPS